MKKTKTYATIGRFLKAAENGKLPRGAKGTIDHGFLTVRGPYDRKNENVGDLIFE